MKHLSLPLSIDERVSLKAGEPVLISGEVYTARDAAHKKIHELQQKGEPLPFELSNCWIYYVGPTPAKQGQVIGSAGPTTSSRMDSYVPELAELGMQGMIGKGRRSDEVKQAIIEHKMIYLVAAGGAGALLSHSIVKREPIAFEELMAEAVTKITVKDFPCFVGIDTEGNDIYDID